MSQIHLSYKLDLAPESTWLTVNPTATAKSNLIYVQGGWGILLPGRNILPPAATCPPT